MAYFLGSHTIKRYFLHALIWRGRKITAEKFMHNTLFALKKVSLFNQFDVFYYSLSVLRPILYLRPIKSGSMVVRVAVAPTEHRRHLYASRFLLTAARDTRGSVALPKVVSLLRAVFFGVKNNASEKKNSVYREALENRVFMRHLKFTD